MKGKDSVNHRTVVLEEWSLDQLHHRHLGT